MHEFTPNTQTMVEILTQRLAESEVKAAQWQSIAVDLQKKVDQQESQNDEAPVEYPPEEIEEAE